MKTLVLISVMGSLAAGGIGAGAWYYSGAEQRAKDHAAIEAKASKLARYKREEEPHRLTVVGHVFPLIHGRRNSSVPVMVKLVVSGSKGLKAVCRRMPYVKEAVVRTLSPSGAAATDSAGRLDLARYEPRLQRAINAAVAANAVKSLHAVMLAAGGGVGSRMTSKMCQEALKS